MKHISALLLLTLICFPISPAAQDTSETTHEDGNHLILHCKAAVDGLSSNSWKNPHEAYSSGFCYALVQGIGWASPSVCAPKGAKVTQAMRVVVKYLEDNPAQLNWDENLLVDTALSKAFPCAKN